MVCEFLVCMAFGCCLFLLQCFWLVSASIVFFLCLDGAFRLWFCGVGVAWLYERPY